MKRGRKQNPMTLKINKASVLPPQASRRSSGVVSSRNAHHSHHSFSQHRLFSQDIINSDLIMLSQEKEISAKRISCPPVVKYPRQDNQMQSKLPTDLIRRWQAPEQKCQHGEEIDHRIGMIETTVSRMGMILDSLQADIMQVKQGEREEVLELESIRQKLIFHDDTLQLVKKGLQDVKSIVDECFKVASGQENAHSHTVFQEINSVLAVLPHKLECHVHKVIIEEVQAIAWTLNTSRQGPATPIIHPPQGITGNSASLQIICPRKSMPHKVQQTPLFVKNEKCMSEKVHQAPLFVKNEKGVSEKVHQAPLVLKEDIDVGAKVQEAPFVLKKDSGGWKSVKRDKDHHEDRINKRSNQKGETPNQLEKDDKFITELDEETNEGSSCLLLGKERDFYFGSNTGSYTAKDEKKENKSIPQSARRRKREHSSPIIIDCHRIPAKDKPWLTYARRRKKISD